MVSASPPREMDFVTASSQLAESRKATMDSGTEPWQVISKL